MKNNTVLLYKGKIALLPSIEEMAKEITLQNTCVFCRHYIWKKKLTWNGFAFCNKFCRDTYRFA